jgi:hypothetical protein
MKDGPHPMFVRAYPTLEGWWWYRIWTGEAWTPPSRRATTLDLLIAAGDSANTATKRLRNARNSYDRFVSRGGVVDEEDLTGAP